VSAAARRRSSWAVAGLAVLILTPARAAERAGASPENVESDHVGNGKGKAEPPASDGRLADILNGPSSPPARPNDIGPADAVASSVWTLDCSQRPGVVLEACQAALSEYYVYRQHGLEHRQKVFAWQHRSSIAIFVVVVLLVFAGIYFAAVQFHHGLRQPRGFAPAALVTEVEASVKGIKVTSPVLGVIILVISLAFFYLYLAVVYPIKEIF
jgi:hypothetical protein